MTNHKVSLLYIRWSQTWWPICTTCFYLALEPLVIKGSFSQNALCVSNDGCTSQFKGARNWFHVSRYLKLLSFPKFPYGFMMYWNYWGINLEKGLHDGEGLVSSKPSRNNNLNLMVKICKTLMVWHCTPLKVNESTSCCIWRRKKRC